jgi:hypothetical protein
MSAVRSSARVQWRDRASVEVMMLSRSVPTLGRAAMKSLSSAICRLAFLRSRDGRFE